MMNENTRIIFFGTPKFAVASLNILVKNGYNIVAVVTAPDKPAGRGLEIKMPAVKEFAFSKNIKVLQPEKLNNEDFVNQLREKKPDIGVVVAFRKLPEQVWKMPALGTFNLHASLLPHYRGAAPINWSIINGEKETGLTTFFLNEEIDTGKIIFRVKVNIDENETAGELHDKMMNHGADLVLKTVRAIESGNFTTEVQASFVSPNKKLKSAPKIFKNDCKINWEKSIDDIYDFIRGLSPYPTAWTELKNTSQLSLQGGETILLKIFKSKKEYAQHEFPIGEIIIGNKCNSSLPIVVPADKQDEVKMEKHQLFAKIAVKDGFIYLTEVQLAGRKKMHIEEFLRGFSFDNWKIICS
ncbi:MAG: methionyl-tRNA formyltransferase [Bacteroidota bacterium]